MFDNMTKFQLRAACRTAGIRNASKMTNDQMRDALAKHAQDNLQPSHMVDRLPMDLENQYTGEADAVSADGIVDLKLTDEIGKPKNPVIHHGIVNSDVPAGTVETVSVVNNTPPRGNRKGRKVPARLRTAGRLARYESRHPGYLRSKQRKLDLTAASV